MGDPTGRRPPRGVARHTRRGLGALGAVLAVLLPVSASGPGVCPRSGAGGVSPGFVPPPGAPRSGGPPERGPPAGSPLAVNGRLRVCGTRLCNEHGSPVQLRGMSAHGLQWYQDCLTRGSLEALARDWKADVLRLPVYVREGGYESGPRRTTDRVHGLVAQAAALGMYVIVDWHVLGPGDPHRDLGRAATFFTEIARRHAARGNVLYEIVNEPYLVPWARVRDYAERLVPLIRRYDPRAPVLVGTRGWSSLGVSENSDEREIVNAPVRAGNVMYTFHFYAGAHGRRYLDALSRAADRIPVFVSEFGTTDPQGVGDDFGRPGGIST
ncbi:glycoside hydrolase family 5 protein [Actinomadura miaoliensis]|uniref:cellulase n=1 Tax=Actinomadura miaoliensis TaxID=430685 RepID=A0ABP7W1P4_9ACTN